MRLRRLAEQGGRRPVRARRVAASLAAAPLAALLLVAEPQVAPSRQSSIAQATEAPVLQRDGEVQARIAGVARATNEAETAAALDALRASVSADFADLVPQLALFLLEADGERAGMTPALIVSRLGITRAQILRAVAPHLDTPDAKLRAQLENLLGAVELEDVRVFLVERGATPPADGLVRYLYARSAADAVVLLRDPARAGAQRPTAVVEVEEARAALAAGRSTDDQRARAASVLGGLARDPDWRLRAYAAAVLRDAAALALPDGAALERLTADREPRVRAVARAGSVAAGR